MNRIDRLTAILIHLQSRRVTKASDIAQRFDISLRTVYRDIRALEGAGVPIGSEAGIGYFLAEGYSLPPVVFSPEEAQALIMARQFVSQLTDSSLNDAYESALFKIKSVLKTDEQDMLDDLQDKVRVMPPPSRAAHPNEIHLARVQQALVQRQVVEMDYFSPSSGVFTHRKVEPIGLVYYNDAWHTIAYCRLRQDYRDFRLDRVSKANILNERYQLRDRISLEQYLQQQSRSTEARLVKVFFEQPAVRYALRYRYQHGFVQEIQHEQGVEMWFMVASDRYFLRWLLTFTNKTKIIEPLNLRQGMHELVKEFEQLDL